MPDSPTNFRHLALQLATQGSAIFPGGGGRRVSPTTSANKANAGGHGRSLNTSVDLITANWSTEQEQRKEEDKPALPEAISLILEVDPRTFDAEALKSFGIEVVADLEEGYIIGASADTDLSELREKIGNFINAERGGGKVPEIWQILDGTQRPEYILSDVLKAEWEELSDGQEYIVDVGIACIDIREQYSKCPKRKISDTDEKFQESVDRWLSKHKLTRREWDDLFFERSEQLENFVRQYNGKILSTIEGDEIGASRLPDSFSCRIGISGKGLKDLVLNFPYIFDVCEYDEFRVPIGNPESDGSSRGSYTLEEPATNAPRVCVIDSGIQERHPLLKAAIDSAHSTSWVPGEKDSTADHVPNGGHGTRVAGAIIYPVEVPKTGNQQAPCWIQNARVLDRDNYLPKRLFLPTVLEDIVGYYYSRTKTRIYNHSITGITPCRTQSMSAWAAAIDKLTWEKNGDILFVVAAGNLRVYETLVTRPSLAEHLRAGRNYPDYLLTPSGRIANPAQSFQALTVGSVAHADYQDPPMQSLAAQDYCSAFSCTGLGIWDTIKPEVVEYGGDYVIDAENSPNFLTPESVCPELVRSTLHGGSAVSADAVGTSFAAPKVTHIAAALEAAYPEASALLYRALIVQSARLPEWTEESIERLYHGIRTMGYGIPNFSRALENAPNRITFATTSIEYIQAKQAKVYQVQVPKSVLRQGEGFDILVEITLSYAAEPRRTRRHRRKYLSTWLDWNCSKSGEDPDVFLARMLKEYDQVSLDSDEGKGLFDWTLGKRQMKVKPDGSSNSMGIDGKVKEVSRNTGTIQKDWAVVKSFNLREGFCIAVLGHEGWNKDPESTIPYSLVVSFEAINSEVPIYGPFAEVQQPVQVQQQQVNLLTS
jgi:hypothetical protein